MHSEIYKNMSDPITDENHVGDVLLSTSHIAIIKAGVDTINVAQNGVFDNAMGIKKHIDNLDAKIVCQLQVEAAKEIKLAAKTVQANYAICVAACIMIDKVLKEVDSNSDILRNPLFTSFINNGAVNLGIGDKAAFVRDIAFANNK